MTVRRNRAGRPLMPVGTLWMPLAVAGLLTVSLLVVLLTVRDLPSWVVIVWIAVMVTLVGAIALLALRRSTQFLRTLSADDRRKHYPIVAPRKLWAVLPLLVVVSGLVVWADIEKWLGFSGWNVAIYGLWFPYWMVVFRSIAARRAAASPSSGADVSHG